MHSDVQSSFVRVSLVCIILRNSLERGKKFENKNAKKEIFLVASTCEASYCLRHVQNGLIILSQSKRFQREKIIVPIYKHRKIPEKF